MLRKFFFFAAFAVAFVCAQTQQDADVAGDTDYQKADRELTSVYGKIIEEYKDDAAFIAALRASERAWIKFRDAEVTMKFPETEPGYYGSSYPMCVSAYKAELTRARTRELRQWLDGAPEGDVCGGSVKTKE